MPRKTVARTARLASIPLGVAGRAVGGWGKRLAGKSAEQVSAEMSAKTAEQLFAVLGQLKGGAMKFGQALSVFEAAVPDELAEPYRDALTKLQSAAPPMSTAAMHRVLAQQLGRAWRERFAEFDDTPSAAASIGQVHKAVWHDGRRVAVKVQYPGADEALMSDLRQLSRFARLFQPLMPGTEVKPLLDELTARMSEELDYRRESDNQRAFAKAFDGDDLVLVPKVLASSPKVTITEWVDGTPLSKIIKDGTQEERNLVGHLLSVFHFSSPERVGLLHCDPHPGNFMLLDDGRLCVIDFGAVVDLGGSMPWQLGKMTRMAIDGESEALLQLMREERFVRPGVQLDPVDVLNYFAPFTEPAAVDTFHFTRRWMQKQAERLSDFSGKDFKTGWSMNLPPEYLMLQRTTGGVTGILCQLGAEVRMREIVEKWQPGFAD